MGRVNRVMLVVALAFVLAIGCRPNSGNQLKKEPVTESVDVPVPPVIKSSEPESKFVTNSIGMRLAYIPAGEFLMGSPDSEEQRGADEGTQHKVRMTKAFHIGVYEVKQSDYENVIGKNPSKFIGPDNPVEQVNWHEAVEFCKKLSELPDEKKAGRRYRLPTEAEWEYACRAGTTTVFHYGDSLSSKQANFNGEVPYGGAEKGPYIGKTTKVGSYRPNAWGLYDMHGNVWEWCLDGPRTYMAKSVDDPKGPDGAKVFRVLRGGRYQDEGFTCRSARRFSRDPSWRYFYLGFRVVLEPPSDC